MLSQRVTNSYRKKFTTRSQHTHNMLCKWAWLWHTTVLTEKPIQFFLQKTMYVVVGTVFQYTQALRHKKVNAICNKIHLLIQAHEPILWLWWRSTSLHIALNFPWSVHTRSFIPWAYHCTAVPWTFIVTSRYRFLEIYWFFYIVFFKKRYVSAERSVLQL